MTAPRTKGLWELRPEGIDKLHKYLAKKDLQMPANMICVVNINEKDRKDRKDRQDRKEFLWYAGGEFVSYVTDGELVSYVTDGIRVGKSYAMVANNLSHSVDSKGNQVEYTY
jgi:hypothetical protein